MLDIQRTETSSDIKPINLCPFYQNKYGAESEIKAVGKLDKFWPDRRLAIESHFGQAELFV